MLAPKWHMTRSLGLRPRCFVIMCRKQGILKRAKEIYRVIIFLFHRTGEACLHLLKGHCLSVHWRTRPSLEFTDGVKRAGLTFRRSHGQGLTLATLVRPPAQTSKPGMSELNGGMPAQVLSAGLGLGALVPS